MAEPIKGIASATGLKSDGVRVTVIHTRWNERVISALSDGCIGELERQGVPASNIRVVTVPGSFELPFAARGAMDDSDVVVCIGCLIKGGTMHFEYICEAVSQGIMRLNTEHPSRTPVIFGVLACLTEEQALERAGLLPGAKNHGIEWGQSALEMAALKRSPPAYPGSACQATQAKEESG